MCHIHKAFTEPKFKYAYVPGYIFLNFGDHKISNKSSVWDSNHIKLGNVLAANASVKNVGQLQ